MFWTRDWLSGRSALQGADYGESMNGTSGSETIYGNGGSDFINAGGGNDIVYGGTGTDVLKGGGGADYLNGGADADLLQGGADRDILTGGTGRDTFQFLSVGDSWATTAGADHVTDFQTGDTLDVSSYVTGHATWGSNNITASSMENAQSMANSLAANYGYGSALFHSSNGRDVYVLMDLNGDRYMETGVVLDNLPRADLDFLATNHEWLLS